MLRLAIILMLLLVAADAVEPTAVTLAAPLTTVVPCPLPLPTGPGRTLTVQVQVPAGAPADLGVGIQVRDAHGRWFQRGLPGVLTPGTHSLKVDLDEPGGLVDEPGASALTWRDADLGSVAGLYFWSTRPSRAVLSVGGWGVSAAARPLATAGILTAMRLDQPRVTAGARWTCEVMPEPFPAVPEDPAEFALDLVVSRPDGSVERLPAFAWQPMRHQDRGDLEEVLPAGPPRFQARWRARVPGVHHLRLEGSWGGSATRAWTLPDVTVSGPAWDGYARVDRTDPRFLQVEGRWWWPLGLNINNPWDLRCRDILATQLTPGRGSLTYDAYLTRLAAGGGDAVEIWMSSWNLALEWRGDWPPYQGRGRFSQENASRLDHILDRAWQLGVRVNLVINNHGMGSDTTDAQWQHNPWNSALGGPVANARDFFSDPEALAGQDRMRRYLVGRWAEHPAVLAWKLWSEINLTAAGDRALAWHERAAADFHRLDPYAHPVTTHWAGDYRTPDRRIVRLPGLDMITIDAYHDSGQGIAELLRSSTLAQDGLGVFGKPILVAEYGGNWNGTSVDQMAAELAIGPWAALVTGHAGAPMLWWFEWVDQGARYGQYGALRRFIAGEDLRSRADSIAKAVDLRAVGPAGGLWAKGWSRPGRLLGYLLDAPWGRSGRNARLLEGVILAIGGAIAPGTMTVEWWDCDRGEALERTVITHPGGALTLSAPAFSRHLAFKLTRK